MLHRHPWFLYFNKSQFFIFQEISSLYLLDTQGLLHHFKPFVFHISTVTDSLTFLHPYVVK